MNTLLPIAEVNTEALGDEDYLIDLTQPAIISVPLGFLGCILGSLLSKEESRADRRFEELYVRAGRQRRRMTAASR